MRVVVDANLVLAIALPLPYSESARLMMTEWKKSGEEILAPALWEYEVTSALRRAVVIGLLEPGESVSTLQHIMHLNVKSIHPSLVLHEQALKWASRLEQARPYDAQYIALSEQMGLNFWTADKRLVGKCRQLGAAWVHWIGEKE